MTQTKLASRASDLKRRIYASLPFGYRVAQLLVRLKIADDFLKRNVGRALYAEFIKAGVTGMPDVKGEPALDLQDKIIGLKERGPLLLPSGYGTAFGGEMWAVASKFLHTRDPEAISDVLQNVVVEVYARTEREAKSQLRAEPLASAESFIKKLVNLRARDWLKKKDHGQSSLTDSETGGQPDLRSTKFLSRLFHKIDRGDVGSFKREIGQIDRVNPDRPWSYIEGVIEGLSNTQIAKSWGVGRSVVTNKLKDWLPEFKRIFLKYMEPEDIASAM